jgi:hypothetical protein
MAQILRDIRHAEYLGPNSHQIKILGDNQEVLALVKNPYLNKKSKYIDICYYYTRDLEDKGRIQVLYILIEDIIADGLIKPLSRPGFEKFIQQLGMIIQDQTSVGV